MIQNRTEKPSTKAIIWLQQKNMMIEKQKMLFIHRSLTPKSLKSKNPK